MIRIRTDRDNEFDGLARWAGRALELAQRRTAKTQRGAHKDPA